MRFTTKFVSALAAVVAVALLVTALAPQSASAEDLPYKAFGIGLKAGATVEAFNGSTSVGKTTADTLGNWILEIPATKASNGTKITFAINGVTANESVTWQSGQFPTPPGLKLTASGAAAPTPTPVASPTAVAAPGATGTFSAPPVFSTSGVAQVVFNTGTVTQLVNEATKAGASSIWAQNASGGFVAFIPGAPPFVNILFEAAFPGVLNITSVTLVKHAD
jgi:hypothetical protein